MSRISFNEFKKIEIKIGKILSVEKIPEANKLYKIMVEVGNEKKQCVAGLAGHYKIDELESKLVVVVTNLEIKKMFGLESQVMLLAAVNNSQVSLLHPGKELPTGTIIM
tara:strand:- start:97 stop:423 length:327 start_codon:yes stop_codon:yes gene_type:complete